MILARMMAFVGHTPTMRNPHWPGLRHVSAALAATGCLFLASCGGSAGSHPPAPKPASTVTAEPTGGAAAVAAIAANWKTVFNGKAPLPLRLELLQDGQQVEAFVEAQAKTSFGAAAAGSTATVSSVTITSPSHATVDYEVLLLGTPLLKHQVGMAVLVNGVWKVGIASFCGLTYLEYSKNSPHLPAVCRS
jgi:hypothetical protein